MVSLLDLELESDGGGVLLHMFDFYFCLCIVVSAFLQGIDLCIYQFMVLWLFWYWIMKTTA